MVEPYKTFEVKEARHREDIPFKKILEQAKLNECERLQIHVCLELGDQALRGGEMNSETSQGKLLAMAIVCISIVVVAT